MLVLDGQIYGTMANSKLKNLTFYLAVPEGGQPQKLSDVQFLLTVDNGNVNSTTPTNITPNTSVLAAGSKVQTTLTLDNGPTAGGTFTLEIKPKVGASTLVAKTLATGYNGGVII